jgi:hypothetical protein
VKLSEPKAFEQSGLKNLIQTFSKKGEKLEEKNLE